ncbi:MAG TPA: helix-turn-helix transcriptional regulator [Chloroflexia bacterium]|jgi:transcriptional regulator with XRE-family HTH domain
MNGSLEQEIKVNFGKRLRRLRQAKGFSQESLAHACGLDRTYVGGVERGERNISLLNIHKIACALETTPRELFE